MEHQEADSHSQGQPLESEIRVEPTSNLAALQQWVGRYKKLNTESGFITREYIDQLFAPLGVKTTDLISLDGQQVREDEFRSFLDKASMETEKEKDAISWERADRSSTAYFIRKREMEERREQPPIPVKDQPDKLFGEYECARAIVVIFDQLLSTQLQERYSDLIETAKKVKAESEGVLLFGIAEMGVKGFEDDVLKSTNLPLHNINVEVKLQNGEVSPRWYKFRESLEEIALCTANPEIRDQYSLVINDLYHQYWSCFRREDIWERNYSRLSFPKLPMVDPDKIDSDLQKAIDKFGASCDKENWKALQVSPEQTRRVFDIVHKRLMQNLYDGGYESWPGSQAAWTFARIKDPRALPGLIGHLRMFGAGHTSAVVVGAIREISQNPISEEDLETVENYMGEPDRSIINEWYRRPDTIIGRLVEEGDHYQIASIINNATAYLAYGRLVTLAEDIVRAEGKEIDQDTARAYFYGNFEWAKEQTEKIDHILLQNLDRVRLLMASSKFSDWRTAVPGIFNELVSPENGDFFAFPQLIGREGLHLSSESLAKLEKLYGSRDLQKGVLARGSFAEGLLFLSSKENGKEIMEEILAVTPLSREDPSRIRAIFRMMQILDRFGIFQFNPKGSLREIISDLRHKVVGAVQEKMQLGFNEVPVLEENLDVLLETGLFEIVPSLLVRYQEQNKEKVAELIREVGRHIILGDFVEWRNSLETAGKQMEILSDDKRQAWLQPTEEIRVQIAIKREEEARQGAVDAIKRIAAEAKAHILELYKLDFSYKRMEELRQTSKRLIEELKKEGSLESKKDLGIQKRAIDQELQIIEGFSSLDSLDSGQFDSIRVLEMISKIKNALNALQGMDQPKQDLDQIGEVLTTQRELSTVEDLRAYDSDDPYALLKIGVEPRETCQSWRKGSHNYCLPAYVADANKRVLNVESQRGEVLGRSVIKLTHILGENEEKIPAILLEPIYTTSELPHIYKAIIKLALKKAQSIGAVLVVANEIEVNTGTDNKRTIPLLSREAEKNQLPIQTKGVEIFIPQSANAYEYSDTLGGDISYFDRYQPIKALIVG